MVLIASAILCTTVVSAEEHGQNLVYLGAGSTKSDTSLKSKKTPISLGYLNISNVSNAVLGVDVSGEGTMLDSTWGKNNSVKQAISYNALIGRNIFKGEKSRVDATLLVGARETFTDCPSSYLGYQCYSDKAPKTNYKVNYGAVLTGTYNSYMLGMRVTGESAQVLIGFRF